MWGAVIVVSMLVKCQHASAAASTVGIQAPPTNNTPIYIMASLNEISSIDTTLSSFYIDTYLSLSWRDDRLKNFTADPDWQFSGADFFTPQPEIINCRSECTHSWYYSINIPGWLRTSQLVSEADLADGTWVYASTRISGTLSALYNVADFPYDSQHMSFMIEDAYFFSPWLVYVAATSGFPHPRGLTMLDPQGWNLIGTEATTSDVLYEEFEEVYTRLTLTTCVQRQFVYYETRLIVNVILLVAICVATLMLKADSADRMSIAVTVFVAIISWLFIVTTSVPRTSVMTRLDDIMNASFAATLALVCAHGLQHILYNWTHGKRAKKEAGGKWRMWPKMCRQLAGQDTAGAVRGLHANRQSGGGGSGGSGGTAPASSTKTRPLSAPRNTLNPLHSRKSTVVQLPSTANPGQPQVVGDLGSQDEAGARVNTFTLSSMQVGSNDRVAAGSWPLSASSAVRQLEIDVLEEEGETQLKGYRQTAGAGAPRRGTGELLAQPCLRSQHGRAYAACINQLRACACWCLPPVNWPCSRRRRRGCTCGCTPLRIVDAFVGLLVLVCYAAYVGSLMSIRFQTPPACSYTSSPVV